MAQGSISFEMLVVMALLVGAALLIISFVGLPEIKLPGTQTPTPVPVNNPVPSPEPSAEPTPAATETPVSQLAEENISFDKNSIEAGLIQETSTTRILKISNMSDEKKEIPVKLDWVQGEVDFVIPENNVSLEPKETKELELKFSATIEAVGIYSGAIKFIVSGAGSDVTVTIPVTIEIGAKEVEDSDLEIKPSNILFEQEIGGTERYARSIEICNAGLNTLSGIPFKRSMNDAGEWIEPMLHIGSLKPGECEEREVTVSIPEGKSIGSYNGTILAGTGVNQAMVGIRVKVKGLKDSVNIGMSDAAYGLCWRDQCKSIEGILLENLGERELEITGIRVSGWSENDNDDANLVGIKFDGSIVWTGNSSDGNWIDFNTLSLEPNQKIENLSFVFSDLIREDNEQFVIEIRFSDRSINKTDQWPGETGKGGFEFSWENAEFTEKGRSISGFTLSNTSATESTGISRMRIRRFNRRDRDNSNIMQIDLGEEKVYFDFTGPGNGWADIANFEIAPMQFFTGGNRLRFARRIDNDYEIVVIDFEFLDGNIYTTEPWPGHIEADLWGWDGEFQPIGFETDINSEANTYGLGAGNDGWDWASNVFSTEGDYCVRFNADPNDDNSASDSLVGQNRAIMIYIGDYKDECRSPGTASGAYGIEFEVSEEMHSLVESGGKVIFSYDWNIFNNNLDENNSVWIKARIWGPSGREYLGRNYDLNNDDSTNDMFFRSVPGDFNGFMEIDVSDKFKSAGTYYLELGAKVLDWGNKEWAEFRFDNISLVFALPE